MIGKWCRVQGRGRTRPRILFYGVLWMGGVMTQITLGQTFVLKDVQESLSPAEETRITKIAEQMVIFHKRHFDLPDPIVLPILAFATEAGFNEHMIRTVGAVISRTGYFSLTRWEIVVNKSHRFYMEVITHEVQHLLLHSRYRTPPKWLDEGLSEFFEMGYVARSGLYVPAARYKRKRIEGWAQQRKLPALRVILNEHAQVNPDLDAVIRTVGWSLVYFFMHSDEGKAHLSKIITAMEDGKINSRRAVQKNYPGGMRALERDWQEFVWRMPTQIELSG